MAFDILSMFRAEQPPQNRLAQPMAQPQGPMNMLAGVGQLPPNPTGGQIAVGPDGQNYQFAETTGMAANDGTGQGWIRTSMAPNGLGRRISNFANSDFGSGLVDTFSGWAMGSTPNESLGLGAKLAMAGRADRRSEKQSKEQQNQTVEWLKSRGMDDNQARMVAGNSSALSEFIKNQVNPPAPETTDDIREYNFAQQQGYQGSFNDFMTEQRRAGATTVNNNIPGAPNIGTIPQGYAARQDPNTGEWTMAPIAGGPAAMEQQAADQARQNAATNTQQSSNVVIEDISRLRNRVESAPWYNPATGFGSQWMRENVAGSNAADAAELARTIRSNVGFDRLQQMREASPTGGALGNVTERELQDLQSVLGSLEQSQSEEQFLQNLDRLDAIYGDIQRKAAAYPNASQFGFEAQPEASSIPDGTIAENDQGQRIIYRNGRWEPM